MAHVYVHCHFSQNNTNVCTLWVKSYDWQIPARISSSQQPAAAPSSSQLTVASSLQPMLCTNTKAEHPTTAAAVVDQVSGVQIVVLLIQDPVPIPTEITRKVTYQRAT
eukprot:GHUV01025113.1.p1 GENE.GHUV01025113.1~~GHUV01025113.1.p1  ORF type:complete len:108 (+),score=23.75 GHUV01025113.1:172-495(+)